ncbi:MAG: thermonuclease family protein [Magnetococcales bacterium]|nr:thermonuclease family protein [Magnetococcales bacterium]
MSIHRMVVKCRVFSCCLLKIFLIGWLFTPALAGAEEWRGRVIRVLDGDTLMVAREGRAERIRLSGVDTPEKGQPFAEEAKRYTMERVDRRLVLVREKERDRYGRLVAWVTPVGQEELGAALVRAGLAWRHIRYSRDAELAGLERQARSRGLGLWADSHPTPPWEWKRRHRR